LRENGLSNQESQLTVYTIGHSTRTLEEFTDLLQTYHITLLIDIRTAPHSRHNPQFNKEALPTTLKQISVKYIHLPEIGGLRHPKPDSINSALENASFRGYADYMQTKEFTDALLKIVALARENCVALMCAEALPWKCHRILISDVLVARNIRVLHIISKDSTIAHQLNELAHVEGGKVTYPLYSKETTQRTLGDFGAG
jgi:uncharacterized protein (DUF488 family)